MASSVMASVSFKPSSLMFEKSADGRRLQSLARTSSFKVEVNVGKKIKTDKAYSIFKFLPLSRFFLPIGINDGMSLMDGVDSSRTKAKGKAVYQHVENYGDNVDGYRHDWIGHLRSDSCQVS